MPTNPFPPKKPMMDMPPGDEEAGDGLPEEGEMKATGAELLDGAEKEGKLKPLEDLVKEEGLPCTARDLLTYAQDVPELHGKSPEELAGMLRDDPSLVDEVLSKKPEAEFKSYDDTRKDAMSSIPAGEDEED